MRIGGSVVDGKLFVDYFFVFVEMAANGRNKTELK
jgi:hypothetical protein